MCDELGMMPWVATCRSPPQFPFFYLQCLCIYRCLCKQPKDTIDPMRGLRVECCSRTPHLYHFACVVFFFFCVLFSCLFAPLVPGACVGSSDRVRWATWPPPTPCQASTGNGTVSIGTRWTPAGRPPRRPRRRPRTSASGWFRGRPKARCGNAERTPTRTPCLQEFDGSNDFSSCS